MLQSIPLSEIVRNPEQPRTVFEPKALAEPTAVRAIDATAPTRLILIVRSSDATGLLQEPKSPEPQSKNSTAPVSKLYIAPVILTPPFASISASTGLSFRISATVISTFFRATASTKA